MFSAGGSSLALHADGRKSLDDRPPRLENPRPEGAEPTQRRTPLLHFTLSQDNRVSTVTPTTISTTPTKCMNVFGSICRSRGANGLRYIPQLVRKLKNLSIPATIGPMPSPRRSNHQERFSLTSIVSTSHPKGVKKYPAGYMQNFCNLSGLM